MSPWTLVDGLLLAHAVHYAIVAVGLVGIVALLAPQLLTPHAGPQAPRDGHEERVLALRAQLAGQASGAPGRTAAAHQSPHRAHHQETTPAGSTAAGLLLPVTVVSSLGAAGVHAAVGPDHFAERTLFGLFFAGAALLQLTWAWAVVRRPSARLLQAGLAGNLSVLALWALTRTAGLPAGLLPDPERVGAWDLAAGGWELMVVLGCVALLATGSGRTQIAARAQWHPLALGWLVASLSALVALTVSGAPG